MDGMVEVPAVVRREYQAAQNGADNLVGPLAAKKGAVSAIVKNNEDPHQKACCQNGQAQGQKIGYSEGCNTWRPRAADRAPGN